MGKGINVYDQVHHAFGSILEAKREDLEKQGAAKKPCIFLSHICVDKKKVKEFGEYIENAGINIYLDVEDKELQAAVNDSDDEKITHFIEVGIRNSTHIMIFLSNVTRTSWWVPFEIGFGKADLKCLACVKLRDVKVDDLSFLKVVRCLRTPTEMDAYLDEILEQRSVLLVETGSRYTMLVDLLAGKTTKMATVRRGFHSLDVHMNDE